MLQLVLGASGTGKSRFILDAVARRAASGASSLLLVPEQFSWEAESEVYRLLGEERASLCTVYSFTSLTRAVEKMFGGGAEDALSDAGRAVLARRAAARLGEELKTPAARRRGSAFCAKCADAIKELKAAGVSAPGLYRLAAGDAQRTRLSDLALIYAEYEALAAGRYADEADRLTRAAGRVTADFFAGQAVYLDGFDGFTAPQLAMVEKLLSADAGCTVALLCDSLAEAEGGWGLFSHTRKTAGTLLAMAKKLDVQAPAPVVLKGAPRFQAPGLAALDAFLRKDTPPATGEGVTLTPAPDVWEETRTAAAQMRLLATREGVAYRDMAVIVPDMEEYRTPLSDAARLYDLPLFLDEGTTAEYSPPVVFMRAALSVARKGLNTPDILRLVKTGLTQWSAADAAVLENYLFTWQITYAAGWQAPFTRNPAGYGAMNAAGAQELARAEAMRAGLVEVLLPFCEKVRCADGAGLSRLLYELLEAFGAPQATAREAEMLSRQGEEEQARARRRAWAAAMACLDAMARLLGDDETDPGDYDELFLLLVRESPLGAAPQGIESVQAVGADRMRLASPSHVFVLGLAEGLFPAVGEGDSLLTYADRQYLHENGIELQGDFLVRSLRENLYFYKALTAASRRLYLSWADAGGSLAVSARAGAFCAAAQAEPLALSFEAYASTPAAALAALAAGWNAPGPREASLAEALGRAGHEQAVDALSAAAAPRPDRLPDTAALARMLGGEMHLSPTRVERYETCPFAYFLQYTLRLRPRRKAELSPIESGSFLHAVLEQVMAALGENFSAAADDELARLAGEAADRYVEEFLAGGAGTARQQAALIRLKGAAAQLLQAMAREQRQSAFRPVAYEMDLGEDTEIPSTVMELPGGRRVRVNGKIDRLDVMEGEDGPYIRVVDYKTGTKKFSLLDVYNGLNTQMLLYLFTVCRNADGPLAGGIPAGVLYVLGDKSPKTMGREEELPVYSVDGIVLDDPRVIQGMDSGVTGLYVPFSFTKDGIPGRAGDRLASLAKMGAISAHIEKTVADMATEIYEGYIAARPLQDPKHNPCTYCDYVSVCRRGTGAPGRPYAVPEHLFEPADDEATPAGEKEGSNG